MCVALRLSKNWEKNLGCFGETLDKKPQMSTERRRPRWRKSWFPRTNHGNVNGQAGAKPVSPYFPQRRQENVALPFAITSTKLGAEIFKERYGSRSHTTKDRGGLDHGNSAGDGGGDETGRLLRLKLEPRRKIAQLRKNGALLSRCSVSGKADPRNGQRSPSPRSRISLVPLHSQHL